MRASLLTGCVLVGACTFNTTGLTPSRDAPPSEGRADHAWSDGLADHDGPRDGVMADVTVDQATPPDRLPPDQPLSADKSKPLDTSLADKPKPLDKSPGDKPKPLDKSPADNQKPDIKNPDTSPPSCLALFQNKGIPGFVFCSETSTTCVFFYDPTSTDNCSNMCAKGGRGCIKSAEDTSNGCATDIDRDCAFEHGDGVCTCNR